MDRLAAMRAFVEIVDRGSLTAAAESLDRSLPAVVRTLAALEDYLGAVLLRRTTRRMSLTPEGREFLERSRRILSDVDEAERAVGPTDGEPRGPLRVTGPVQFGQLHLVPAISGFLHRYEQVRVDLLLLDRVVDLVEEGIDLALRIGYLADSSLVAVGIGHVRWVVCASPALLSRVGTPDHPAALSGVPCILQQNLSRNVSVWAFRHSRQELSVAVDGRFSSNQIAAAARACVNGVGFGRFLSYQVQQMVADRQLVVVLEEFEPDPWPVSLVYPGGRRTSARLRALISWLQKALAKRGQGKFL